ncbi:hypothetical protein [Micromonospora fluostatini]|uniref:hypothetical protein n=1 Tax=Micromonospora sp. JCM 30529 TaxID=3421643 RepID=UPI003D185CBD
MVRGRIWCAAAVVLLASGCAKENEPVALPAMAPVPNGAVAASAGGACGMLDFAVIEEHAGVRFDVAAASERGDSHTCVLRVGRESLPELTLSVSKTSLDKAAFTADMVPDKAEKVAGLGQEAYRRTVAASGKNGPAAEVGWLADESRLAVLHYTLPPDTERAAAEELTGKLADLAKTIQVAPL